MVIGEHIRNSTPYKLYANGSPEYRLFNRSNGIAEIILWVKILNFKKFDFQPKIYENSLEDQWEHKRNSRAYRLYANGRPEGNLSNHDSGIAEIILWVKILNLKKIYSRPKIYENSLEDQ